MTTKQEQELKALKQIAAIVEGLGADSGVSVAFEGCFEIAESNIKNGHTYSMKQRAEKAETDCKYLNRGAELYANELERVNLELATLKNKIAAETGTNKAAGK